MARRTDCIYCGGPTGSREHPFPAALGGRRRNKGILCGKCNNGFSSLDAHLSRQLRSLNGFLGVRPDHDDEPTSAIVHEQDGTALHMNHLGKASLAQPRVHIDEPTADGRRHMRVEFSSERQVQEWLTKQRAEGKDVQHLEREEVSRFSVEPVRVALEFGGDESLREIARVAVNFLAEYFPDEARSPKLAALKKYVLGGRAAGIPTPVWHSDEETEPDFRHRILLHLRSTGTSYARVSFFETIVLFVDFGELGEIVDTAVEIVIDPLAESAPDDRSKHLRDPCLLAPRVRSTTSPTDLVGSRLPRLLRMIADKQWRDTTQGLLEAVNACALIEIRERRRRIAELLEVRRQRILNLATHVTKQLKKVPGLERVAVGAAHLVSADATSTSGLSPQAMCVMELVRLALADEICRRLQDSPLSDEELRLLLEGGPGAHVAAKVITDAVMKGIEKAALTP